MASEGQSCPNCDALLQGEWCHQCGQKALSDEERTLAWLLSQFVSRITSFDGKLPRSLVSLALRPGQLGADWLAGRRARWASPISLFLVINLLYFLSPPITDFNLPLEDHLDGQPHSAWAFSLVESRVPETDETLDGPRQLSQRPGFDEFERTFNERIKGLAKTLLILHVPVLAIALMVLHWRRRVYFVDHFVNATHFWAFLLLAMMVFPRLTTLCSGLMFRWGWVESASAGGLYWKTATMSLILFYFVVQLRRAYAQSWWMAVLKAVPAFAGVVLGHLVYRGVIFGITMLVI